MAKHRRLPLVEVTWLDACTYSEQWSLNEVLTRAKLVERRSVGYLLAEDHEGLTIIAGTYDPSPTVENVGVADITVIPKQWVKAMKGRYKRQKGKKKHEPIRNEVADSGAGSGAGGPSRDS